MRAVSSAAGAKSTNASDGRLETRLVLAPSAALALLLAACQSAPPPGDPFVGTWECEGETRTLTSREVEAAGARKRIAFIEEGKNADFDITLTDGERLALFDVEGRTLTWHSFADGTTTACRRA